MKNKKSRAYYISFICCLLTLCFGCQSESELFENQSLKYYPIKIGNFVSYEITETVYALQKKPRITSYQIKDRIESVFRQGMNGRPNVYKVNRYQRKNGKYKWELKSVWTFWRDGRRVIRTESGTSHVVLTFPIEAGKIWNGNIFNNLGRQNYEITKPKGTYVPTGRNLVFEETVTVQESQDSSAVKKNVSNAIYAKDVGLIYRISEKYSYCQTASCFGRGIIDSGNKIEQKIIDFGTE